MRKLLPDAWLDELRARVDIVDVVGDSVPLKQRGRRFWGCCPFHGETKPSFSVDTDNQMFYCFGCHKGGTVITFVQEYERVGFMDAVRMLAERAHMELPERADGPSDTDTRALKERVYEANQLAARYYFDLLYTPEGAGALTYLYKRGLDDAGIKRFGLGYSPKHGELTAFLTEKGFEFDVLSRAWLSASRDGRRYDMFRGRVMFPIINGQGRVLGFGGRALEDAEPKYLNTADTPVFNKRQGLYAINMVKKERSLKRLILVEGYMDVVSLRNAGVPGVVATLGTALSEEQARLFPRLAPEVHVCYDGDSAGQKAILRALEIFDALRVSARVIEIPGGMDPDDYVKAHGAAGFEALRPMPPAEYRLNRVREAHDLTTLDGRTAYAIAACAVLRGVENPVDLDRYLRALSVETGVAYEVLEKQMGKKAAPAPEKRPAPRPSKQAPKGETWEAEAALLRLCASGQIERDNLSPALFPTPLLRRLAEGLVAGKTPAALLDELEDAERTEAAGVFQTAIEAGEVNAALVMEDCLRALRRKQIGDQIAEKRDQYNQETDPAKKAELMRDMAALTREYA